MDEAVTFGWRAERDVDWAVRTRLKISILRRMEGEWGGEEEGKSGKKVRDMSEE
jgi:hypothetical protein